MKIPPFGLQDHLLLADGSLQGSCFGRSVILITAHALSQGARGLVLNRPSAGKQLGDLLSAPDFRALRAVPVYEGGPVSPEELILVALRWNAAAKRLERRSPLGIQAALDALAGGWDLRAFVGYTGWSAGQLEGELAQASWIVAPPQAAALEQGAAAGLWAQLLRTMPDPRLVLLAGLPEDPGLN